MSEISGMSLNAHCPRRNGRRTKPYFASASNLQETKDFEPTNVPKPGAYDGYARIRSKIDSATKKFQFALRPKTHRGYDAGYLNIQFIGRVPPSKCCDLKGL